MTIACRPGQNIFKLGPSLIITPPWPHYTCRLSMCRRRHRALSCCPSLHRCPSRHRRRRRRRRCSRSMTTLPRRRLQPAACHPVNRQRTASADGASGRRQRTAPADGISGRRQRTASADGASGRRQRTAPADGASGRRQRTASADGASGRRQRTASADERTMEVQSDAAYGRVYCSGLGLHFTVTIRVRVTVGFRARFYVYGYTVGFRVAVLHRRKSM